MGALIVVEIQPCFFRAGCRYASGIAGEIGIRVILPAPWLAVKVHIDAARRFHNIVGQFRRMHRAESDAGAVKRLKGGTGPPAGMTELGHIAKARPQGGQQTIGILPAPVE